MKNIWSERMTVSFYVPLIFISIFCIFVIIKYEKNTVIFDIEIWLKSNFFISLNIINVKNNSFKLSNTALKKNWMMKLLGWNKTHLEPNSPIRQFASNSRCCLKVHLQFGPNSARYQISIKLDDNLYIIKNKYIN
jgi:hypothetical protein